LREYERLEDNERIKVGVHSIANHFQETDMSNSAELFSSVFKENVQEIDLEIICNEIRQRKVE
jgi:hypothetical protein